MGRPAPAAETQATRLAPEAPIARPSAPLEVGRRPRQRATGSVREARASSTPKLRKTRLATGRLLRAALAVPNTTVRTRISSLAQLLLLVRSSGQGKRLRRADKPHYSARPLIVTSHSFRTGGKKNVVSSDPFTH